MIAVDTNLLVYAHRPEFEFNAAAYALVADLAEGNRPWGIPVACISEFVAIVTNAKLFKPASTLKQASQQMDAWLESPSVSVLHSGSDHWPILRTLLAKANLSDGRIHDASIAAICIENQVNEIWTSERDFAKFAPLKMRSPLRD